MPTAAIATFGIGILVPLKNPEGAQTESLKLLASTTFLAGQILYEATAGVYGPYAGTVTAVASTSAITTTGTVTTFTVANSLVAGQYVTITGAVPVQYNGTFEVASATGSLFTVNGMPTGLGAAGTQGVVTITQNPTHILQYSCITDASNNVSFGAGITAGATEWGQTAQSAPAFRSGYFSCADLVGLDAGAVRALGRLEQGTIAAGHFSMYGN